MDTKINYTMVGLIVVVMISFLVAFILWWSSSFNRQSYDTYKIYMTQDVGGLSDQGPVKFNGVPVGNVTDIQLSEKDPQEVILYIRVIQGTPITTSTVATLASQGITGVSYVSLSAKTPNAPPLIMTPGEDYPVIPSEPSLMTQVLALVKEASVDFKDISKSLRSMFDTQNVQNFKEILQNVATASKQMPAAMMEVRQSAAQINTLTANMNQAMPSAVQLLDHLNQISGNLSTVTQDMKQNPAVLLRGTNNVTTGPGE